MASCSCSGGKPYCSCQGGACTSTWGRIGLFGGSGRGENVAAGSNDPIKTFSQWVKSSGHWSNVNKSSHRQMGAGHYGGPGKGCYSHLWVQVFGSGSSTPRLPAGAHYPQGGGPGAQLKFWASYHDPAGGPKAAMVNIGGTCYPMKLERGAKESGTYLYIHPFKTAACHHYYFVFTTKGGQRLTFPTSGSYGVDISAPKSCPDHTAKIRPSLGKGCGGCMSDKECADTNPCTRDRCVAGKCQRTKIAGCCTGHTQCDDKNKCTTDRCDAKTHKCTHQKIPSCGNAGASDSGAGSGGDGGTDGAPAPFEPSTEEGCAVGGAARPGLWVLLLFPWLVQRLTRA